MVRHPFLFVLFIAPISALDDVHVLVLLPDLDQDVYGYKAAIDMAARTVNQDDRLLNDYRVVVHYHDTKCHRGETINGIYKTRQKLPTIHFVIGPVKTENIKDVIAYLQLLKVNQITFGTDMNEIYGYTRSEYSSSHHRIAPQVETFSKIKAELLLHFNWKRAAVFYDFPLSSSADSVSYQLQEKNITVILKQDYFAGDRDLIRQQLMELKEKDSRIIIAEIGNDPADIMCEVFKLRLFAPRFVWIVRARFQSKWLVQHNTNCSQEQLEEAAAYHFTFDFSQMREDGNLTTATNLTAGEFVESLKTLKSSKPGNTTTRKSCSHVNNGGNGSDHGVIYRSSYAFDAIWLMALTLQKSIDFSIIQNLTKYKYQDWRTTLKISKLLRKIKFEGLSGYVSLDNYYGIRENNIRILQYREGMYKEVGVYNGRKQEIQIHPEEEEFIFMGKAVPKDKFTFITVLSSYNSTAVLITNVVTSLCIIVSLFFLFVNIRYRSHKVIRMSSPNVNSIILCGSFLCYASIILHGLDHRTVGKSALPWVSRASDLCISFGFTILFGGFFAKTWRVYKIFTASEKLKKVKMLSQNMYLLLLCLVIIDAVLFTTWYILSEISIQLKDISQVDDALADTITTTYQVEVKSTHQTEFYAALFFVKGLMLVFGLFLAWQTRNVSIELLNDSKEIGLAVYNVSVLSGIGVVSLTALRVTSSQLMIYIVSSLCIGIATFVSMLIVFLPKVLLVFRQANVSDDQTMSTFHKSVSTTSVYTAEFSTVADL